MARINLPHLPRRLDPAPTYNSLYKAALQGIFPASFSGTRWSVEERDLPAIAAALGVSVAHPAETAAAA